MCRGLNGVLIECELEDPKGPLRGDLAFTILGPLCISSSTEGATYVNP